MKESLKLLYGKFRRIERYKKIFHLWNEVQDGLKGGKRIENSYLRSCIYGITDSRRDEFGYTGGDEQGISTCNRDVPIRTLQRIRRLWGGYRAEMDRLRQYIAKRKKEKVICVPPHRLSHNLVDRLIVCKELERHEVELNVGQADESIF
jgi:hypothetical protein